MGHMQKPKHLAAAWTNSFISTGSNVTSLRTNLRQLPRVFFSRQMLHCKMNRLNSKQNERRKGNWEGQNNTAGRISILLLIQDMTYYLRPHVVRYCICSCGFSYSICHFMAAAIKLQMTLWRRPLTETLTRWHGTIVCSLACCRSCKLHTKPCSPFRGPHICSRSSKAATQDEETDVLDMLPTNKWNLQRSPQCCAKFSGSYASLVIPAVATAPTVVLPNRHSWFVAIAARKSVRICRQSI